MKKNELKANLRKEINKRSNKKIRKEGKIPVNYYSRGEDNINLIIDSHDFMQILKTGVHVIDLNIGKKAKNVLIKEIQFHPVTDEILHVDFQGVSLKEDIDVDINLNFIGDAIGIKEGGVPEMQMHSIEIRCKAGEIPKSLDVDISQMDIGDILFVKDLDFGDLEILSNPDSIIATVTVPHIELEAQIPEEGEELEVGEVGAEEEVEGEVEGEEGVEAAEGEEKTETDGNKDKQEKDKE
ncbi:MAG: 50S ribosomal protein L25 [Candidatus Marinimicrobia bacterium]|nr:50S ribosomal protein L25 [Candidatus Neomarinimicrobiota bacterium]